MSAKWRRSRQWDDDHFPAWAWPAKRVLRAFSSITLAVVLLSLVAVYAILASIPIGLLALLPTYLVYAATLVLTLGVTALAPSLVVHRVLRGAGRAARFTAVLALLLGLGLIGAWLWSAVVWPQVRYDAGHGTGLRLFAGFCERYKSIPLRRLPGLEMSELEFYAWWPLRVVLLAFVLNMVVATARRIEFTLPYLGVLTVHTGIVVIALGSIYYKAMKREGSTVLWAGPPGPDGIPGIGRAQSVFFDNTRIALYISQGAGWEQRRLRAVPRYNDYNLDALGSVGLQAILEAPGDRTGSLGPLDVRVPPSSAALVDPNIRFRIIGYASYAQPRPDVVPGEPAVPGRENPLRLVEVVPRSSEATTKGLVGVLFPRVPALRTAVETAFELEYTIAMPTARWADLTRPVPPDTRHALILRIPALGVDELVPLATGEPREVAGHRVELLELHDEPPFPIITRGYEEATSSLAVVRITRPDGASFDRWIYHRFPEIGQDFVATAPGEPPQRRPADPAFDLVYIDASRPHIFADELLDGTIRAAIRRPGGELAIVEGLREGARLEDESIPWAVRFGDRWAHAEPVEHPSPVPEPMRRRDFVGTHDSAMICLETSVAGSSWKHTQWIPFTSFPGTNYGPQEERSVVLPDGGSIRVMWGRLQHPFPDFNVQLVDFQVEQYDHRGAPRDFQSRLLVSPSGRGRNFEPYEHITRLNAPLQAPFIWSDRRALPANIAGFIASRLDPAQFKLSQSGWDAGGWRESQAAADRGEIPRPFASFTLLGVGNNPGIHVIALGGVLVIAGIPWAFYVKPWLARRRKHRIQASRRRPAEAIPEEVAP